MKKVLSSLCFVGLLSFPLAASAADCVASNDIEHCPVGNASLHATDAGLIVTGLGVDGRDGVDSRFAPTVFWNGLVEVPAGENEILTLSSKSGDESLSKLFVESIGGQLHLWAQFNAEGSEATYSVLIYKGGVLQGSLGGFDGRDPAKLAGQSPRVEKKRGTLKLPSHDFYVTAFPPDDLSHDWYEDFTCLITPGGGGTWGLHLAATATFTLPDGREVVGDQIRFTEDVKVAANHRHPDFDAVEIRTSHSQLVIAEEFAEAGH